MIMNKSSKYKYLYQSRGVPWLFKNNFITATTSTISGSWQICDPYEILQRGRRFHQKNEKEEDATFLAFLERHSNSNHDKHDDDDDDDGSHREKQLNKVMKAETLEELEKERQELFNEAKAMTLSLYRTCIRCTRNIRHGNEHDERDFQAREEDQKAKQTDFKKMMSASFSFEPPVDRENELLSRSSYYLAFVKESFGQEVDCLKNNPWREDDVSRFTFLMKQGEERRSWILKGYKFDDPYYDSSQKTLLKVESWDKRASDMVQKVYRTNGWLLSSDFAVGDDMNDMTMEEAMEDDGDFDWDGESKDK